MLNEEDLTRPGTDPGFADDEGRADAPPDTDLPAEDGADSGAPAPRQLSIGQLRRQRKRLWEQRQETLYHVGGLAVDLYRRDQLDQPLLRRRVEVVLAQEAELETLDETLTDVESRRHRPTSSGVEVEHAAEPVGYCMSCGAPFLEEAAFCFRCGARIMSVQPDADTQIIDMPGDKYS